MIPHSMLNDGESTRFADDQISPLHNHDGYEVGGLEGEFQLLPLVQRLYRTHEHKDRKSVV